MRTDVSKKVADSEKHKNNIENVENMKTRKTLHPIQESAGDKENLVGAGRIMPPSGKEPQKSIRKVSTPNCKIEKKKHTVTSKTDKKITAEDLTSEAGPSDHYWEVLAERRRIALEKALEENRELHERIAGLEAENEHCKKILEESKELIDTLTVTGPSEYYWEVLAERRKIALNKTVIENRELWKFVDALKAENEYLKIELEKCSSYIENLTEMLNEPDDSVNSSSFVSDHDQSVESRPRDE